MVLFLSWGWQTYLNNLFYLFLLWPLGEVFFFFYSGIIIPFFLFYFYFHLKISLKTQILTEVIVTWMVLFCLQWWILPFWLNLLPSCFNFAYKLGLMYAIRSSFFIFIFWIQELEVVISSKKCPEPNSVKRRLAVGLGELLSFSLLGFGFSGFLSIGYFLSFLFPQIKQ